MTRRPLPFVSAAASSLVTLVAVSRGYHTFLTLRGAPDQVLHGRRAPITSDSVLHDREEPVRVLRHKKRLSGASAVECHESIPRLGD